MMYKGGVIEESNTVEWNSGIFLVSKKDGTKRLVIDLRGLNAVIAPKLVQLPRITDLIDGCACHKVSI